MRFSFSVLIEFFLPGLILLSAILLGLEGGFRQEVHEVLRYLAERPPQILLPIWFVAGMACYFLGTTINGVSNCVLRLIFKNYRRKMIRRKLGLKNDNYKEYKLHFKETMTIDAALPGLKSIEDGDHRWLNELYSSARTFAETVSERAGNVIGYHRSLLRLSRATIFPLFIVSVVFLFRCFFADWSLGNTIPLSLSTVLLVLGIFNYLYREKFGSWNSLVEQAL